MGSAFRALAVLLLVLSVSATGRAHQDTGGEGLDIARTALNDGSASEFELGRHVATLLAAEDLQTLSQLLVEGPEVVSKVIIETLAFNDDVRFVGALLELTARAEGQPVADLARHLIDDQAARHVELRADLLARLDPDEPEGGVADVAQRVAIISALGQSRDLTVVPGLLQQLAGASAEVPATETSAGADGPGGGSPQDVRPTVGSDVGSAVVPAEASAESSGSPTADEDGQAAVEWVRDAVLTAFERLSGHELPEGAEPLAFWTALWDRQQREGLTREDLLEEGQALQRTRWDAERARLTRELRLREAQVAEARMEAMGGKIDRLIEALDDEYAAVRQAAAQRLADHPSHDRATAAIRVLLDHLGHGEETLGGPGQGLAAETGADIAAGPEQHVEQNAQVRATIVRALGSLGRDRTEVLSCLLDELADGDRLVARASVEALSKVKGQTMVVRPLLDFLDSANPDEDLTVQVLEIIASNDPEGALDELSLRLSVATEGRVRAALVRAMIASKELGQAMAVLSVLVTSAEPFEVRFALAQWLGERLATLPLDAPPRPAMVGVIESLLADADESVRAQAAKSLGQSGDPRAAELLAQRAQNEVSGSVLLDIVSALGQVGSLECAASIGWIQSHDTASAGEALDERAREALRAIGRDRPWADWLTMAESLGAAQAHGLALVVINEVLMPRTEGAVIEAELADKARGLQAIELVAAGATQDGHDLLLQLEEEGKAFPPREQRLDLLARTSQTLGLHDEAADWLAQLLEGRVEADARFEELQRSLAGELLAARRHDEALQLIEGLRAVQPADNQLMLWYGQALILAGRDDEARGVLERLQSRLSETDTAILEETRLALEQLADPAAADVAGEVSPSAENAPAGGGVDGSQAGAAGASPEQPPAAGEQPEGDGGGTGNR